MLRKQIISERVACTVNSSTRVHRPKIKIDMKPMRWNDPAETIHTALVYPILRRMGIWRKAFEFINALGTWKDSGLGGQWTQHVLSNHAIWQTLMMNVAKVQVAEKSAVEPISGDVNTLRHQRSLAAAGQDAGEWRFNNQWQLQWRERSQHFQLKLYIASIDSHLKHAKGYYVRICSFY